MDQADTTRLTTLLNELSASAAPKPVDELMALVYDEVRDIAHRYFQRERPNHTLQPTALVHEAYLRLVDQTRVDWRGQTHFRAICAKIMRRVLVDYARRRQRVRRGGDQQTEPLDATIPTPDLGDVDLIALHDAIERLTALDSRQARVVEMRFFGGLSMSEIAQALGVSLRTVESDWTHAKAWLRAEMQPRADQ